MYIGLHVKYRLLLLGCNETGILWAELISAYPSVGVVFFMLNTTTSLGK